MPINFFVATNQPSELTIGFLAGVVTGMLFLFFLELVIYGALVALGLV